MNDIKWIWNHKKSRKQSNEISVSLQKNEIENVLRFHTSFPQYKETPLVRLKTLATTLGVGEIYVKDESYRFDLNSFKVLGGSYAIAQCLARKLNMTQDQMTFDNLNSAASREKLGKITFATATDGNHGKGIAWIANQLGHKSIVYMPKGSSLNRYESIKESGAETTITDLNYDDSVRLAAQNAKHYGWEIIQDTAWEGYTEIPSYIMQGYATMAMEALSQLQQNEKEPTHIIVQAGVGAFAGAMLGFFNSIMKNSPIGIVVEAQEANCLFQTCEKKDGTLHKVDGDMMTIMAGLACGEPNPLAWNILSEHTDLFVSATNSITAKGMRILGNPLQGDMRIISGESGAVTMGFLKELLQNDHYAEIKTKLGIGSQSTVLLFSTEGDTDPENYRKIVWDCDDNIS